MTHRFVQTTAGGRLGTAAALALTALAFAAPARAEDSSPDPEPASCSTGAGSDLPTGTVTTQPTGGGLPGTFGQGGIFVCIDGQWVFIVNPTGPQGPIFMENAPTVTADNSAVTIDEGATAANTGLATYTDSTPVTLGASAGTVTGQGVLWAWSFPTTDGPAQSQSVIITGTADQKVGGTTFDLTVNNVAPSVQSVTPDVATSVVGQPVTFQGIATDASPEDTAAGFSWAFNGVAATGDTYTTSFSECGTATVTSTATDKDGGTSAVATSTAVNVAEVAFAAPFTSDGYNIVRSGQVVPVRLDVGCDGTALEGLSPSIQLLSGDVDPAADPGDPAQLVPTTDASADSSNVMRSAGGSYLYNLRVPSAPSGSLFTVRIRPFAGSTSAAYAVLQIRG